MTFFVLFFPASGYLGTPDTAKQGKRKMTNYVSEQTRLRELQTRLNSHLPTREAPEGSNKHAQIRTPTKQSEYPENTPKISRNSWLLVCFPYALLYALRIFLTNGRTCSRRGGVNSGRFGARKRLLAKANAADPEVGVRQSSRAAYSTHRDAMEARTKNTMQLTWMDSKTKKED